MRASSLLLLVLVACGGGSSPPPAQPAPATTNAPPAPAAEPPAAEPASQEQAESAPADDRTQGEIDMDAITDEVCACADKACFDEVMERWARRMEGKKGDASARPTERMMAAAQRMGKCVTRIMEASMPAPVDHDGGDDDEGDD